MAKLSAHGTELYRFLSCTRGGLVSVRSDGTKLFRSPFGGWKLIARKKKEISLEEWTRRKLAWRDEDRAKRPWAHEVKSLPSLRTLDRWAMDSVCETTDGQTIEPDGVALNGSPSWLIALRMI